MVDEIENNDKNIKTSVFNKLISFMLLFQIHSFIKKK